jgi:fluoroacetyl-CoA thioesterase
MLPTITPGDTTQLAYRVPPSKTVRHIFTESPEFATFPEVFATGFLVALVEWTCARALAPHLEDGEGNLGVHVSLSHRAPTPPGLDVTVDATVSAVEDRRVTFEVRAHDGIDTIAVGTHERAVVDLSRFNARVTAKSPDTLRGGPHATRRT